MQSNAKERYTEISVYMQNETKRKRRRRMTFVQLFAIVTIEVDRGKPVHNQTKSKKCIGCNQFAIRCNCTVQCYIYIAPANKKKKTANLPFTSNHLAMPTKSNNNKNNVCVHHFFPIHFNVIFVTFSRSKTKWMIMGCQTNDRVGR